MHADCESESGREGEGEAGRREGGKGVYGEEEDWVGKGKGSGESIHNVIDAVGTLFILYKTQHFCNYWQSDFSLTYQI